MIFIIVHGTIYDRQSGLPYYGVVRAAVIDTMDQEAREEWERQAAQYMRTEGTKLKVYFLAAVEQDLSGQPFNKVS